MKAVTTKYALGQYAVQIQKSDEHRREFSEFTGLSLKTINDLFRGKQYSNGLALMKIQRFLELNGYKLVEIESLQPEVKALGDLAAYNLVDVDTIMKELGYTSTDNTLRVLRGYLKSLPAEKKRTAQKIAREYETLFQRVRSNWVERIKTRAIPEDSLESSNDVSPEVSSSEDEIMLVGLAKALQPVARRIVQGSTSSQRKRIRESIGIRKLFELSTDLNRLGSETAFTQYASSKSSSRNQQ